jgi:hypothetical protein
MGLVDVADKTGEDEGGKSVVLEGVALGHNAKFFSPRLFGF